MSDGRHTPSWPSLYNFLVEIEPIEHRDPIQPKGRYLYNANGRCLRPRPRADNTHDRIHLLDIYRFTLYWTFIFYTPAFIFAGTYAFLNLAFTQQSRVRRFLFLSPSSYSAVATTSADVPLQRLASPNPDYASRPGPPRAKTNERRSRLLFALLVALTFASCAVCGAVIGSAVMGYVMAGLFRAAHFNMST